MAKKMVRERKKALASWIIDDTCDIQQAPWGNEKIDHCYFIDSDINCYAVVSQDELKDFIKEHILHEHLLYNYVIEDVSEVTNISLDEISEYFETKVRVNGRIFKWGVGSTYIEGRDLNGLIEGKIELHDFVEKLIDMKMSKNKEQELLDFDSQKTKDFYLYFVREN